MGLNTGGISSKFRYKILTEYIKKIDIGLFSETKLLKIPQSEFPDYDIFSLKQKTRLHGLALLIKNSVFTYFKNICHRQPYNKW